VEADDPAVAQSGEAWMSAHQAAAREIGPADFGPSGLRSWISRMVGFLLVHAARWIVNRVVPRGNRRPIRGTGVIPEAKTGLPTGVAPVQLLD